MEESLKEFLKYDSDTGELRWIKKPSKKILIGSLAGNPDKYGYLRFNLNKINYKVHRVAWLLTYGAWPLNDIDHINGIKNDNRLGNLRDVTRRENSLNQRRHREGKLPGATYFKEINKWEAKIRIGTTRVSLGYFESAELANARYVKELQNV